MTKLEAAALEAMRASVAAGWAEEHQLVDAGKQVLIRSGIAPGGAELGAQMVYDKHYRIMGAG